LNGKVRKLAALVAAIGVSGGAASASSAAWCKGGVSVQTARARVGKVVRVKARVAGTHFARSSSGSPTFIDLEFAYPDARRLTLVIWEEDRGSFPSAPERMFRRGSTVCAQGYVSRYRGAAEIEVSLWDAASRLLTF
jgi:DNA/RNA endonuclease YhcR with UshA esterase domain